MLIYEDVYSVDETKGTFGDRYGSKDGFDKQRTHFDIQILHMSRSHSGDIDQQIAKKESVTQSWKEKMESCPALSEALSHSNDSDTYLDEQRTIHTYEQSYVQSMHLEPLGECVISKSSVFLPVSSDQNSHSHDIDEKMAGTEVEKWMNCDNWLDIEGPDSPQNDSSDSRVNPATKSNSHDERMKSLSSEDSQFTVMLPKSLAGNNVVCSNSGSLPSLSAYNRAPRYDPDSGDGNSTLFSKETIHWDPASLAVVEKCWSKMAFAAAFITIVSPLCCRYLRL
jgi:hypothetical protein